MPLQHEPHGYGDPKPFAVVYRQPVALGNTGTNGDRDRDQPADTNRVRSQLWVGFGCGPICGHSPSCRDTRLAARRAARKHVA